MNQHVKAVHKIIRIRNHVCGECGHADSRKGSLEMHIKQVHLKIRSLVCEECGFAVVLSAVQFRFKPVYMALWPATISLN